ncbi:hypothetical protein [Candidatus Nitrosocosmicus sp. T]
MIDLIIVIGLVIDVVAALMMYYGKIFRPTETIEQISKHSEHEIKHRNLIKNSLDFIPNKSGKIILKVEELKEADNVQTLVKTISYFQ